MLVQSHDEFIERMKDPAALTLQEFCGMADWLKQTPVGIDGVLNMRLAIEQAQALLENCRAIESFDRPSRRLTRWLIGLTFVLVFLTLVMAGFTVLLWVRK